jgi:hypothetical protein
MDIPADARAIPGHPGYFVTPRGDVWSGPHPERARQMKPRRLAQMVGRNWYANVALASTGKHYVHVLVLRAFRGERGPGMWARHLDGNPLNNAASNLAWGTARENSADQVRHGTAIHGERVASARFTARQVVLMRALREAGARLKHIAAMFNIRPGAAHAIVTGRSWKHLPLRPNAARSAICLA